MVDLSIEHLGAFRRSHGDQCVLILGNAFEYYQQSARVNTATAVADGAVKPTSTLTVTPVTDRARVIAHLSEPTPIRLGSGCGSTTTRCGVGCRPRWSRAFWTG